MNGLDDINIPGMVVLIVCAWAALVWQVVKDLHARKLRRDAERRVRR